MQANRRLVKYEERVFLAARELACQLEALRLAAGKRRGGLAERKVPKPQVGKHRKLGLGRTQAGLGKRITRLVNGIGEKRRQADVARQANLGRRTAIARAPAIRARDVNVREKLHVERNLPCAVAGRAPQAPRVVRERARFETTLLGLGQLGIGAAQVVEHAGVGRHRRAHVSPNGRGIDEVGAAQPLGLHGPHMRGQLLARNSCAQSRNKALQHERRLAAARDPCDRGEPSSRNLDRERPHRVNRPRLEPHRAMDEHIACRRALTHAHTPCTREERPDARGRRGLDLLHRALGNDAASIRT